MKAHPPEKIPAPETNTMATMAPSDQPMTAAKTAAVRSVRRAILLLNLEGLVVSANGVAIKALGVAESNFLGQPITNLFERPSAARMKQYFDRALKGSAVKCQALMKAIGDQSGLPVSLLIRLHVMGPNCSLEAAWDILDASEEIGLPAPQPHTEVAARKAAFETLFQAYLELGEINKQKTSMLAAATHELKTPLAVINGSCELLLAGSLGALNPQQREIVQLSVQNCRRLLNVVNSFLDYSAVERGKLSLVLAEHDPGEMVAEAAKYWKKLGQARGIQFDYATARELPAVRCDRGKLQNVLNSLCENALKYTPKGGQVTLVADLHFWERRIAAVSVSTDRRGREDEAEANGVRFSVTDNGPGIPSEFHQEIFEDYFQVPGTAFGGMGLGLAIARKIVTAHKGKIWVESRMGQGTAFHLVIPL
jgi:signal transduction histidine kinase